MYNCSFSSLYDDGLMTTEATTIAILNSWEFKGDFDYLQGSK